MKASFQLRMSQQLALTPQLQQSIRLLQLSTLELNQEIEQALADNPLLERDDDPSAAHLQLAGDGSIRAEAPGPAPGEAAPPGEGEEPHAGEAAAGEAGAGDEHEPGDWGSGAARSDRDDRDDEGAPQNWAASQATLRDHLRQQLAATRTTPRDRALVGFLIEAVEESGYLGAGLEELIALCDPALEIELEEVSAALRLLQSFDPPGVGARDPAECLDLQLQAIEQSPSALARAGGVRLLQLGRRLVRGHLALLAARDFARLRRELGVGDEELRAVQHLIRGLNPHPGVGFATTASDYVIPDILVRRVSGRWAAQLNPEVMPRLRVNQGYAAILKREKGRSPESSWSTRLQEARWLIRNLRQRFQTIERVAQAIVERQSHFFTHGAIAMRPLVLREIADTVGLHESTISRVTANKYMSTPFGVFELRYFFGSHVATEAGGAASSTAIRALIKQLIGAEDPAAPLSDSRIAELLGEQGIVVARRTVAKYRELLQIPPVGMRKSI